ncbi:hypothetical protein P4E33_003854 [Klebsiella pneumoniae]|nr:hypothetical protein [Klebsiella pneumoniae]
MLQQNGTAANGQGRNSPLQGISGISQELPDHAIAELNKRNIVISDGELIVERRLFKHANHAPASLTRQSELLDRCQRAIMKKL